MAASLGGSAAAPAPAPLRPGLVPALLKPGLVVRGGGGSLGPRAVADEAPAPAAASLVADSAQPKTTLMLRNLGAEVTNTIMLQELVFCGVEDRVDFIHVWVDFATKSCTGVAYLNFFDPADARDLQQMWHGREELGGIPCRGHRQRSFLSVVFANKQSFDSCVLEGRWRRVKDLHMMGWIHPSKEYRCRALENGVEGPKAPAKVQLGSSWSPPISPPGVWPPPGISRLQEGYLQALLAYGWAA